ncbi:MAG: hypothetical protein M3N26_12095, partial [Pseudomonadota bacterium]|nr:hypothetical protein [Pseudomonadota bacterium]
MRFNQVFWTAVISAVAYGRPASAADLIAIRPGLMCVSTDALARLTLPSGESRTHVPAPRPNDLRVAAAGGCIDIPPGARVQV